MKLVLAGWTVQSHHRVNKVTLPEVDPLLYELLNEWLPYVDLEP